MTTLVDEIQTQITALNQDPTVDDSINPEEMQFSNTIADIDEHMSLIERLHCDGCELTTGLTEVTTFMMEHRGINQQLANQIEMLIPGLITSKRPIRSYTQEFTKTNYAITMEEMSRTHKQVSAGGVLILMVALYKLFTWLRDKIKAIFGKEDDLKNTIKSAKDTNDRIVKKLKAMTAEMKKDISGSAKTLKKFEDMCKELNIHPNHDFTKDPVAAIESVNQEFYEHCVREHWNKYTKSVQQSNTQPKRLVAVIKFVDENVPHMKDKLDKLSGDLKNDGDLNVADYRFDFHGGKEMLASIAKEFQGEIEEKDLETSKFSLAISSCKNALKKDGSTNEKELPPLNAILETDWNLDAFGEVGKHITNALNGTPELMKRMQGEVDGIADDKKDNRKIVMSTVVDDWHALVHATEIVSWHYVCMVKLINAIDRAVKKNETATKGLMGIGWKD